MSADAWVEKGFLDGIREEKDVEACEPLLSPASPHALAFGTDAAAISDRRKQPASRSPVFLLASTAALTVLGYSYWPFPSSLPLYLAVVLTIPLYAVSEASVAYRQVALTRTLPHWSAARTAVFTLALTISILIAARGFHAPTVDVPDRLEDSDPRRFFIAANLYNNEKVLPYWEDSLLRLATHLGPDRVYVSIYESNSEDATKALLLSLSAKLALLGVPRTIITDTSVRPQYNDTQQRITYLAQARNKALEPLSTAFPSAAPPTSATKSDVKVLFLNDVFWEWEAAMRLINTDDGRYDVACGLDFANAGVYDTCSSLILCLSIGFQLKK